MDALKDLFEELETTKNTAKLDVMYDLVKSMSKNQTIKGYKMLVFSDDFNLLNLLLSDKYYLFTFGVLERMRIITILHL